MSFENAYRLIHQSKKRMEETENKEKEKNYVRSQAESFPRIFSIFRERSRIEFV